MVFVIEDPDVYTFRALINDSPGHFTPEYIQIYLDMARKKVPYIAAALFCISRGNMAMAEMILRFTGAASPDVAAHLEALDEKETQK